MKKRWHTLWMNGCSVDQQKISIAVSEGKIVWMGEELPGAPDDLADHVHDLQNKLITPGLVDCHTHLVFGGNRAREFEMRLQGFSYEEIAKQGGGIQSSVNATRLASEDELFAASLPRAIDLMHSGVTTLEIKSGYGLDWPTEEKILRVAKRIGEALPITIKRTFLGAHIIPKEFSQKPDDYVDVVCREMIPAVAKQQLADAIDVFCEKIAFNTAQTEKIFQAATQHGLAVKCHGEQLSCSDSAVLAAKYQALSVDHLEYASEAGIKAMADAGTVAVLLPGAFYFLREKQLPPIELLRQHKVRMAIASDCNPGTSPITSLHLVMNMACTLFRLTPEEVLLGVTEHAASALGLGATHGQLAVGYAADFAIWNVKSVAELCYFLGNKPLQQLIKAGQIIHDN